ncbi:MAG: polyphosphate glucokinase [Chloroflexota bacterium]|nr:polyphosphate glucokinase [Chloroflexota bacterium]
MTELAIGIDIGGSGIKAGAVDLTTGTLRGDRLRVATPVPSTPHAVVASTARLVRRIVRAVPEAGDRATVPVGVGVPCVVIEGETRTAANIDPGWIDFPAATEFQRALIRDVTVVNDADAAGVAEMRFGAGRGERGTVFVLTLGTGVGSALFVDGVLVPNTELGHMEIRGRDAERRSAAAARVRRGLSWKAWAADLDEHLIAIDRLFSPRLFILGGGVSKNPDKFIPYLTVRVPVVPAQLRNDAGTIGAAMFAAERAAETTLPAVPVDGAPTVGHVEQVEVTKAAVVAIVPADPP